MCICIYIYRYIRICIYILYIYIYIFFFFSVQLGNLPREAGSDQSWPCIYVCKRVAWRQKIQVQPPAISLMGGLSRSRVSHTALTAVCNCQRGGRAAAASQTSPSHRERLLLAPLRKLRSTALKVFSVQLGFLPKEAGSHQSWPCIYACTRRPGGRKPKVQVQHPAI